MDTFAFSPPEHARFLAGYLDAVGRSLTTGTELVSLTCKFFGTRVEVGTQLRSGGIPVDNWSRELCGMADEVLGLDTRSRLGFYMVEYLCWIREFTEGTTCYRIDDSTTGGISYRMELRDGSCIVAAVIRSDKRSV